MDPKNLDSASQYINNQLLSRGLLRDGQTINFVRTHSDENSHDQTMSRIMVVINDLILRRDRDASQRETMTNSIRTLRAESQRLNTEVERLKEAKIEVSRKLAISEAEKNAYESKLRIGEERERTLKIEAKRLKSVADQAKTNCAVECRKREGMIEKLKKTVADTGRVRGSGKGAGHRGVDNMSSAGATQFNTTISSKSVNDEDYDLYSESKQFLAELAKGLSEDNENLTLLLRRTLDTLKKLIGWDRPSQARNTINESGIESLSSELESVIGHIRTLLTNPSFVPLEEVEVREEEIIRLRKGWEDMEQKWKEAVKMMDSWRNRVMHDNEAVNHKEMKIGPRFDPFSSNACKPSPYKLSTVREEIAGESDIENSFEVKDGSDMFEVNPEPKLAEGELDTSFTFSEEIFCDDLYQEKEEDQDNKVPGEQDVVPNLAPLASITVLREFPLSETTGNSSPTRITITTQQPEVTKITEEISFSAKKSGFISKLGAESRNFKSKSVRLSQARLHNPRTPSGNFDTSSFPGDSHTSKPRGMETKLKSISKSASKLASESAISNHKETYGSRSFIQKTPAFQLNLNCPKSLQGLEIKSQSHSMTKNAPQAVSSNLYSEPTPKLKLGPDYRLPLPREVPPQQSPLTLTSIAAKLAASEHEANAARIRAKLRAVRAVKKSVSPVKKQFFIKSGAQGENPPHESPIYGTKFVSDCSDDPHQVTSLDNTYDQDKTNTKIENKATTIHERLIRKRKDSSPARESPLKLVRGAR